MQDLKGKTVLVAGGAGYLGGPLCQLLARQGANVCIGDFNPQRLQNAVTSFRLEHTGARVLGLALDVGDEASIKNCVANCVEHFGSLYGLVNATSGGTGKRLDDLTGPDFDQANRLNLTGPFLMVREAAKHMAGAGSVVMYTSMYGLTAPNQANYPQGINRNPIEYGAGKAGMVQMVRYLAAHYGARNIRVNGVAPGPFPDSERLNLPIKFVDNLARATMLGRIGKPHETAGAVAFLLSEAASYITGHTLPVDGGWTAW